MSCPCPCPTTRSAWANSAWPISPATRPRRPRRNESRHGGRRGTGPGARAGVLVEPARPRDFCRNGRGISDAHTADRQPAERDVVELYDAWDGYRSFMLQFLRPYDAIVCPVAPSRPRFPRGRPPGASALPAFSLLGWPVVVVPAGRTAMVCHRRADRPADGADVDGAGVGRSD